MIQFCFARASERSFSLSRVFRGEKTSGLFWKGLDSNKTPKLRQIQDLFMKTCLFVQSFPCYRWIFDFFASQQLQPNHLMSGFSECLPSSLLLLTCGRLICGLWVPQSEPFIPLVRQKKSYLEEKKGELLLLIADTARTRWAVGSCVKVHSEPR